MIFKIWPMIIILIIEKDIFIHQHFVLDVRTVGQDAFCLLFPRVRMAAFTRHWKYPVNKHNSCVCSSYYIENTEENYRKNVNKSMLDSDSLSDNIFIALNWILRCAAYNVHYISNKAFGSGCALDHIVAAITPCRLRQLQIRPGVIHSYKIQIYG